MYNIGSPKVEQFDGTSWTELPSMNRAKVEHGCTVATIDDSRGILVVGGATGDDLVEFLDWEKRQSWKTLGKINRGRGEVFPPPCFFTGLFLLQKALIFKIMFFKGCKAVKVQANTHDFM